ncbi:amidohydrolase family protein [Amycolatopsis sp. PS_44_ISF1]|uniref:amidohydrolase family protein n=1 Tax=Amycolatopsis sp. PS_44_ISF1 TaxID=2974917 RepID=UPI0028DE888F|nr:amidohydrolase family protein [Amycolatopsis sp. PS_44_ISF1]MDT8913100.1 amidohydrolase family protein [Amycolatopsis sp. PS_44_ISF1]
MTVNRREFLAGVAGAVGAAGLGPAAASAGPRPPSRGGTPLALRQGTNIAAQAAPDGRTLAFDLLGVLWLVPAGGGAARRLTEDLFDIAQPAWSPDGATLVFQSYREGNFDLWTVRADGTGLRRLTSGPFDHREPIFSPDGKKIAYSSDEGGSYGVHVLDLGSGTATAVTDTPEEEYEPAWSPDGTELAFVVSGSKIDVVTLAGGARRTFVTDPGAIVHSPMWTPDGQDLVYARYSGGSLPLAPGTAELVRGGKPLFPGEDVFPFRVSWLSADEYLYTAGGALRRRRLSGGPAADVPFTAPVTVARGPVHSRPRDFTSATPKPVLGIGSPVLSPDGRRIAFRALNDIQVQEIGRPPRPLTGDHWWKSDPAWSPDGTRLAYSTDRGGTLDLWIRDLRSGRDRQLTNLPGLAATSGTWSPDGTAIAFLDQTGALHTAEVATGAVRQVFTATFEPGRPTWSADGRVIALAAVKPFSARYREGLSQILLVDVATGAGRYVEPLPGRSIQTRGDDGPVWSPDGRRMAFVVASVLWVADVHPDGTFAGPPRPITDEVTDAPSWSGDSRTLLYLNNGRLRLIAASGGAPRTVPTTLTWTNTRSRGRVVVRAGRMWDGTARTLRSEVDIVVDGGRVTAVQPTGSGLDGELVDARDGVVVPGLIDMHNHRQMQGYGYGDRQGRLWLSLGFTTTRSPGSPAYHMVEERESIQSGARTGPRYFATGEAIDGSRIYYNFMRPTFDRHQLELELERAEKLDYDLLKAYVRISPEMHRRVIEWGHARRLPVTSHYHYPALALGGDGMEHMGATNRLGYSRTVSLLGTGYDDVVEPFVRRGAARTPTLFAATALFRDDQSLVTDRRVRTLYPAWEYRSLQASVAAAQSADQTAILANLRRQVGQAAAILRGGGRVVTGTDSPIDHTAVSTHMNLRAMVKYGFTPYEALITTTSMAGEVLGEPLGRIAPGHYADLAVLGGDPLADITAAADVRQVLLAGRVHTVDELLAPFETAAPAIAPSRRLRPVPDHPANARFWWHDPHYVASARTSCCSGH